MKNLFLSFALITGTLFFAQENKPKLTPEQREAKRAEMQQKMQQKQKEHLAKMQKDLNLSQDQVNQIQALEDKNHAEREAEMQENHKMRKEKMDEMKGKMKDHDTEMQKILTPEQYQKWQKQREEKRQNMKEKMNNNEGKKGHFRKKGMEKPEINETSETSK